jgi:hypothetical protein
MSHTTASGLHQNDGVLTDYRSPGNRPIPSGSADGHVSRSQQRRRHETRLDCSKSVSSTDQEHLSSMASPILTICSGQSSAGCDAATLRGEEPHRAHK